MELLEAHAVDTYTTFVNTNRQRLSQLPPPSIAKSYYKTGDLYMFDDFQVSRRPGSRRPPCDTLLDVFENIAVDEGEHVRTMQACQDYARFGISVVSPHLRYREGTDTTTTTTTASSSSNKEDDEQVVESNVDKVTAAAQDAEIEQAKRELWKKWSEEINKSQQQEQERKEEQEIRRRP
jgi:hypothetical protein